MSKKQVIVLLSLLFLVAAPLYWFIKSDFISDRIQALAKKSLEPILHQPIQISESELSFFPPSAVLTGIRSQGILPISIKKVQVSFSLWSLFTQSFVIQDILIEHPILSFGPDADIQLDHKKSNIVVRRIRIKEGSVSYQADQQEFSLPHLNITIEPNFNMDRFNVALSGKQGHVIFAKQKKSLDRLEGAFVVHPKGIDVTRVSAQLDKIELGAEGTLLPENLNMRITASMPVEDVIQDRLPLSGKMILQGQVSGRLQNPTVTGKIAIPYLSSKESVTTPAGVMGSIGSDFSYQNNKVSFKNILAKLFLGEAKGAATIEKGSYNLTLRYNHFAMDQVVETFSSQKNGKLAGVAPPFYGLFSKGEVKLSGKGSDLKNMIGSGSLEVKREIAASNVKDTTRLIALLTHGNAAWTKSEEGIRIHQGVLSFLNGKATFDGLLGRNDGLSGNISLEVEQIKEAADIIQIPITGKVRFNGAFSGTIGSPSFAGQVKLNDWTLQQHPFGAFQSQLQYQDKTVTFREGLLEGLKGDEQFVKFGGTVRVNKSDQVPVYNFSAEATSIDPQEILTFFNLNIPLSTTATGKIIVSGIGKKFTVSGPVTASYGSLYGERFTKGQADLTVNETGVRLSNIVMEKNGMTAKGDGEISYHGDYTIDVSTSPLSLDKIDLLRRVQPLRAAPLAGAVPSLVAAPPNLFGEMTLTVSGKGSLKNPELTMLALLQDFQYKEASMESGTIRVDWQGENVVIVSSFPKKDFSLTAEIGAQKPHPFAFKAHFENLPMHPFFSPSSSFSGLSLYAGGDLSGKGSFETLQQTDLSGNLSRLSATWGDYWLTNDGPITFVAQKGDVLIDKGSFKGINTDLTLSGRFLPFKNFGLIVKGSADMNLLRLFTPKVRSGKGVAQLDIRITDQWENPNIQGVLSMKSGLVSLTNLADPIAISALSVVFNRNLLIMETVSGKMGKGQFVGFGKAALKGFDLTSFGFQFDLKEMPIRLTPDLEIQIAGSLVFQGDKSAQLLDGSLHIQKALYEKRINLREMISKWQEDQEERLPIDIPFAGTTRLLIHISGKDNIAVRNNIAKVPLEVGLFLKGTLENPQLFGQIDIPKGSFDFRANEFKVTSGTVQFVNPEKIDPLFDIKGQSRVKDYAIDFSLAGTLSRFVLGLTSFPPLPDADILSLLTLGMKADEVAKSDVVATSIVTDFVAGFFADPVQQLTGLDKIAVGVPTGKTSKSALISVEKRVLNDRILIVSSTTFDAKEQAKVQIFYDIGKHVSVVGEKDEKGQVGGDLRFRFEFR